MIVMKFGGTSVEDAASVERVAGIIRDRLALRPVVVVSAMGKTTRHLLEAAEASAAGDRATTVQIVANIRERHSREAGTLVRERSRPVFGLLDRYFEELMKLLEGLAILGEVPPRGLDKILSYGELISSAVIADALAERGVPARLMDSREFIKTDDRYGDASPLTELTIAAVQEALNPALNADLTPVIQGFIGSTRNGATTTLGFEGSDYTATLVGAALDASDIQIWKDVPGLMTADPRIFPGARTVRSCSFIEAAELTHFGAKVLHPKAIYPAAEKNIPVHIYNSRQPNSTGTHITAVGPQCSNMIKSIAYKRPVTILKLNTGGSGTARPAFDSGLRTLVEIFGRRRLTPFLATVSGSNVTFALDTELFKRAGVSLLDEVAAVGKFEVTDNRAIISVVGENLTGRHGAAIRAFEGGGHPELHLILYGSSPITMSLIVSEESVEEEIARLHSVFFDHLDPDVFS